jgi:hypothetical protein
MAQSNTEFQSFLTSACAAMTSSFLNLVFPTRFVSLSFFLLLDEPQPRETNGDDHHGDENGVLHHRNFPELLNSRQCLFSFGRVADFIPHKIRPLRSAGSIPTVGKRDKRPSHPVVVRCFGVPRI